MAGFNLGQFLHDAIYGAGQAIGTAADAIVPGNQSNWHRPAPAAPQPASTRPVQRPAAEPVPYPDFTRSNPLPNVRFPVLNAPHTNMPLEEVKQAVGGIGRDIVNSVTNVPVHLGLQAADMFNGATGYNDPAMRATYQASNPVTKAIFGSAPIKSYQGQAEDVSSQLKHAGVNPLLAGAASVPLSGLLAAGDLSQFHIAGAAPAAIDSAIREGAPIVGTAMKAPVIANEALGEAGHAALNEPIGTGALHPDSPNYSQQLQDFAKTNYDQLKQQYLAKNATKNPDGSIKQVTLNTDDWRELLPGYRGTNSDTTHPAASMLNKQLFDETLAAQKGKGNNKVLVMAGGGGSGKGTASKQFGDVLQHSDYPVVYDGTTANYGNLFKNIADPARANGMDTHVLFVDRNPQSAAGGIVDRALHARATGGMARTVPLDIGIKDNLGARDAYIKLLQQHPDMARGVIDNNGGEGDARLIEDPKAALDYLSRQSYNVSDIRKAVANDLHQRQNIPEDIRAGLVPPGSETGRQLQLQRSDAHAAGGTTAQRSPKTAARATRPSPGSAQPAPVKPPIVGTPLIKENKFTESVKNSPEVSPEVKAEVSGQHAVRNTKQLMSAQRELIRTQGLDQTTEEVLSRLAVPSGETSDRTLAQALEVAKAHDALGTEAGHSMAASIYDQISEHGVAKGQGVQILSQIARSSPAGLRNKAFRDLKKAGVELTPALKKEIQGHIDAIAKLPDGPAKDFAIAVLRKAVAKHLPQSKVGQAVNVWKAGLLSGVKTQGGNFVSNATFAGLKKASDVPAALADQALSLVTGKREKTSTGRGGSGVVVGLKNAKVTMKTGIDQRNIGDKYEQHAEINFNNPVLQKLLGNPANLVFRGMNAADQPFWYAALKNSLYDQAKADGLNQGLSGAKLRTHMDNLVANPTDKMAQVAEKDANKQTLAYDTFASKGVQAIHQGIDQFKGGSKAGKAIAHTVVDVLAPFTKVPTAFLSRTVDFTPMGIGKEIFSQIAHKQFDQRSLASAIGEGATGTGVIAIGMALAQNGQLSGDYPSKDPKEAARWKAEHIIPNAVKIGGNWISLNYLGPIGLLFNAGSKMVEAGQGGAQAAGQVAAALGGLGQGLLGQSFLQGFSGFSDAVKDPTKVASYINSQAGSVVPSIVNDIGNATDSMQRQANSVLDAIRARIPGMREQLAPKVDTFGNDLAQAAGGLNVAFNPFKPSNDNHTPLLNELDRLAKTGSQNTVFPVASKTIGQGTSAIKLTPDQVNQRQKLVGAQLTSLWNSIIGLPSYAKLTDDQKATALQTALKDINSAVDRTMTTQIDSSKNTKAASGSTLAILQGHPPTPDSYIQKALIKGTGVRGAKLSPADRYTRDVAKYQTAKATGSLNSVQDFSKQKSLDREAVTSKFSSDVVAFYNLSKAEQNAYFAQDKAKATGLYNQAKQLDAQLVSQTGATTKYKYGLGTRPKAAKKSRSAKALGTGKKLDYTARMTASVTSATKNATALRSLVRGGKFSSSKVPKLPKLGSYKVRLAKATKPKVNVA